MAQRLEVPLKYAFIQVYLINGGCNLDSLSGNALIFNRINWSRRIVSRFFSRPLSASGGGSGFFAAGHGATAIKNLAFTHHHFRGNGGGDGGCFFYKNRLGYNFALKLCQNLYFSGVDNFSRVFEFLSKRIPKLAPRKILYSFFSSRDL